MASTTAFCTAAKLAFMKGELLAAHTYKISLYTSTATNGAATTAYSATNEISGTGYSAGGATLGTYSAALSSTTAVLSWANPSWTTATFTAASCLIYDDTDTVAPKRALAVFDFGGNQTVNSGTFTIQFPTADNVNGLIRIG